MFEGFLVGGVREVVPQPSIEFRKVCLGVFLDFLGNIFKRIEMGCGVAVAETMICDHIDALLQKGLEFGVEGCHQGFGVARNL